MRKIILMLSVLFAISLLASCTGKAYGGAHYTCLDSDGGRNAAVQGTVKSEIGSFVDTCRDARALIENYCKGNVPKKETVPCLNGCDDGACKKLGVKKY